MFLVFFVAAGDAVPGVNEAHYLCRLKHYWAETYCPGDLFLESPDAHFTVVWLFGWVTQFLSLEATAWLGRLISWSLLAVGWTRVASRAAPLPLMAPLGALLFVYFRQVFHFAGEWAVGGFEAKSIAYGVVLIALAAAIDGRWNRAWLLLGGASAFHALVGGWSVVALGAAGAVLLTLPPLRSMLPGLVGGGLLAMAGVGPALALNVGTPPEVVGEANQIYVFFRLPHHLAPLTKDADWLYVRLGMHVALVAGLAVLTWLRATRERPALRLVVGYAWAAEAISVAGLAIELIGWNDPEWAASLLKYYWFRLADIAAPIAVSLLLVQWVGEGIADKRRTAVLAAAVLLAIGGWRLGDRAVKRLDAPHAPGDAVMRDPAAWIAMCEWVAENTASDAVFLVPMRSHTFKWRAERAEVVTYKDVPQDAQSMVEWRRRYSDVFQLGEHEDGSPRWTRSLAQLGAGRLREVGAEYGASYALSQAPRGDIADGLPLRHRASLPVAHREGPYTLYEIPAADSTAGSNSQ